MTTPAVIPASDLCIKQFAIQNLKLAEPTEEGGANVGTFTGIANAVGVIDRHNEVIEKGAFDRTLKEQGVEYPLLWQHDPSQPIGIIRLSVDGSGHLVGEGEINLDVPKGKEAYSLLKQGAIKSMSIGFNIPEGGAQWDQKAGLLRILAVEMWETSIVTFPANPAALIDSVKQHLIVKAGRVLSGANRGKLEAARDALTAVLEADQPTPTDDEEDEKDGSKALHPEPVELGGVKALIAEMNAEFERRITA